MSNETKYFNFIRNFDFFGVDINLRFQNQKNYQSICGGIASFIFFSVAVAYCLIFFITFASRQQMNVIFNQKYVSPPPLINFTQQKFNFAISTLFDKNNSLFELEGSPITESASLVRITNSTKKNKLPLLLRPCEANDFFNHFSTDKFQRIQLENKKCIDDGHNLTMQGSFTHEIYQYVEYSINLNKTFFDDVKTEEDFQKKTKFLYSYLTQNVVKVVVDYIDTTVDADQYINPINYQLGSFIALLDISLLQKINLEFSTLLFSTDENILFENYNSNSSIKFDQYASYQSAFLDRTYLSDDNKYNLLKLYFRSSPKFTQIKRQYQKITNYMADMTGLLGQILFIFYIFSNFVNTFELEQAIMNKILKFKDHIIYKQSPEMEKLRKKVLSSKIFKMSSQEIEKEVNGGGYVNENIVEENSEEDIDNSNIQNINTNPNPNLNINNTNNEVNVYSIDKTVKFKKSFLGLNNITNIFNNSKLKLNFTSTFKRPSTKRLVLDNRLIKSLSNLNKQNEENQNNNNEININDNIFINNDINNSTIKKNHKNSRRLSINSDDILPNENNKIINSNNEYSITKDEEVKSVSNTSQNALNLNIFERISLCKFCNKKNLKSKQSLYYKSLNKLYFYLDIQTFIKKMQEIDIIKYLLLSNEQLVLFNFLSKPSISISNNQNEKLLHNEIEQTDLIGYEMKDDEMKQVVKHYEALTREGEDEDNDINKKIVTLFNNEIDYLLN